MKEDFIYKFSEEDYFQNHIDVCHLKEVYTFDKYLPIDKILEIFEGIKKEWEGKDAEFCFDFYDTDDSVTLSAKYWEPETEEQFTNRRAKELFDKQQEINKLKYLMLTYPDYAENFMKTIKSEEDEDNN